MPSSRTELLRSQAGWIALTALFAGIVIGSVGDRVANRVAFAAQPSRDSLYQFDIDSACAARISALVPLLNHGPLSLDSRKDTASLWSRTQRCAWRHDETRRSRMRDIAAKTVLELAKTHLGIPEYHDEQRLRAYPAPADLRLGPAAGIFASPFLSDIGARTQIRAHQTPGMLVAFVVVMREQGEALPPNYQQLGLNWGMNCIWLQVSNNLNDVRAFISSVAEDKGCRPTPAPGTPSLRPLDVVRSPVPAGENVAAARFTEDVNGRPLFGVPCFDGWCDIGPVGGFTPRPPNPALLIAPGYAAGQNYNRKETRVKGWHDEQLMDRHATSGWVHTNVRATFVPRPGINLLGNDAYTNWVHVADIFIEGNPGPGGRIINALRPGWNKVELKREVPGGYVFQFTPDGSTAPTYVAYNLGSHVHMDAPIPGTARWRYTVLDPGAWTPCGDNACCSTGES